MSGTCAGHLLLYWMHKDFTQWFLKFHNTTKEPVLRVSVPHMRFVIVADPVIAQNVLGGAQQQCCNAKFTMLQCCNCTSSSAVIACHHLCQARCI
jgi:hypothetical protein